VPGALELARRLRRGAVVALAADGPRGPRHRAGAGVTRLVAIGRTRAVAVAPMARRGWRLSTRDRLLVPAPFSAVRVVWGAAFADEAQGALQEARRRARGWVGVT